MQPETTKPDCLKILGLSVTSNIGVPAEERAAPQTLKINAILFPLGALQGLLDDFSRTVDYAAVAERIRAVASSRKRKLIETLAEDIASAILTEFPLRRIEVEVLKFILPNADAVAVSLTKTR